MCINKLLGSSILLVHMINRVVYVCQATNWEIRFNKKMCQLCPTQISASLGKRIFTLTLVLALKPKIYLPPYLFIYLFISEQ